MPQTSANRKPAQLIRKIRVLKLWIQVLFHPFNSARLLQAIIEALNSCLLTLSQCKMVQVCPLFWNRDRQQLCKVHRTGLWVCKCQELKEEEIGSLR